MPSADRAPAPPAVVAARAGGAADPQRRPGPCDAHARGFCAMQQRVTAALWQVLDAGRCRRAAPPAGCGTRRHPPRDPGRDEGGGTGGSHATLVLTRRGIAMSAVRSPTPPSHDSSHGRDLFWWHEHVSQKEDQQVQRRRAHRRHASGRPADVRRSRVMRCQQRRMGLPQIRQQHQLVAVDTPGRSASPTTSLPLPADANRRQAGK